MGKIMFIINPKAGNENALEYKDKIIEKLKESFDEVTFKETKDKGQALKYAGEASDKEYEAICVYGGDGTINEVLTGLKDKEYRPKLQILPGGTGNLLTQVIKISQNKEEAIEEMDFSRTKKIDLGLVNDEYVFALFFSLGTISKAIHDVSNDEKADLGFLAYVKDTFLGLLNDEENNLSIKTEEDSYEGPVNHLLISLSNKLMNIKYSNKNDNNSNGLANIYVLTNKSNISKIKAASKAIFGKLEEGQDIKYLKGRTIEVRSMDDKEIETDIDGDKGPSLPVKIEILNSKIELYLPRDYVEDK